MPAPGDSANVLNALRLGWYASPDHGRPAGHQHNPVFERDKIVDLFHAREHLYDLARRLEFMLLDRKDEWLAARLADLDHGYIDGIVTATRKYPLEGVKKAARDRHRSRLLREQRPPRMRYHWFRSAACSPAPASSRPAVRPSSASGSSNPACTGPSAAPTPSPPCAATGQQHLGSHLRHPAHSDTHRLTRHSPKMILTTYKIDAHPSPRSYRRIVIPIADNRIPA